MSRLDDTLRTELLALNDLRARVFRENDTISRLFAPLINITSKPPTRDDLDKAVESFEQKVPGFYIWYFPEEKSYGLFPKPYKPAAQEAQG